MKLAELCQLLETLAPPELSAEWDNNGLLVGDPSADVQRVLLAVDLTDAVLAEAAAESAQLVICHHPAIFRPLRRLRADEQSPGGRVFRAIRQGLAIYAMHTTLDAAAGGTDDVLAGALGLTDTRPLAPHCRPDRSGKPADRSASAGRCKLVTFVPAEAVDRVAEAIFQCGGGRIGGYSRCSFRVAGTGTFLGGEGTTPAVGQAGQFEAAEEVRLEVLVDAGRAAEAVAALRKAHPYETVAFDLYPVESIDERVGLGRIGRLARPAPVGELVQRVKAALGVEAVWLAGPAGADSGQDVRERPGQVDAGIVQVAACCAGSCGELWRRALAEGAGFFLTGELGHHDVLEAVQGGMAVAMVRHWSSERLVLKRVAQRLTEVAAGIEPLVSRVEADPYRWA